ncbi:MAG: putative lipid II flippase FtsW [Thermodesulfobacteriota bacterium]
MTTDRGRHRLGPFRGGSGQGRDPGAATAAPGWSYTTPGPGYVAVPPPRESGVLTRGPCDPWLLLAVGLLILIGEVMVFNTTYFYASEHFDSSYRFVWKHQVAVALGGVGLLIAAAVPSTTYRRLTYPVLLLALCGLVIVFLPGVAHGKVHRWIAFGPLNFQPSELAKGAVALYLAHALAKKAERVTDFVYGLLPPVLVTGCVVALIAVEPDLGGAVLMCLLLLAMLFVAGARVRHLTLLAAGGLVLLVCGILAADYRLDRLSSFLDPVAHRQGTGYQLNQSLLAFGAGGVKGVGLGEGRQKLFYLPEAHTDFIFAVVGEETGLWGTVIILSLFTLVGARGLRAAVRHPHMFGRLLAFGLTFLLVCQAGLNMAVVLGMLPTKGLPLPFVSYGGSSLVTAMTVAGMLASLSRESRRENRAYA